MQPEQLGPYRIERQIGRGGMGTVYAGLDATTGERAAVKVLAAALATDEDFRARFDTEIETLRQLRHENIVRLLGWGEQDGVLFYAMELVDGTSLEDELRGGRRFDWAETKDIAVQVCAALKHAHDRGIVHRDIKPANLLLTRERQVKLSDFGIAKLFGSASATTAGGILGTAEYMAPEQADGRPVGQRGDLYSLGAVLYTLLAGRPPFVAKSVPQLLQMQRFTQPEPLRRFNKSIAPEVEAIVMQLLEKDPERRIANATLLARRLEATFRGLATMAIREQQGAEESAFDVATSGPLAPLDPPEVAQTRIATKAAEPGFASPSDATKGTAPRREGGSGRVSDSAARRGQRRFVTVEEQPVGHDDRRKEAQHWLSPQTLLFLIGLTAVGLVVAYFLQPPDADSLHNRIMARLETQKKQDLLDSKEDIDEFLKYYSADPRSPELQKRLEDIDLASLEKWLENSARMSLSTDKLSLVEREFLEALRLEAQDPPGCVERLEAIARLYDGAGQAKRSPGGAWFKNSQRCVLLAKRRAMRLRDTAQKFIHQHVEAQTERLNHADRLQATSPEQAQQIREAVIVLYRDKLWAAEIVQRARDGLAKVAVNKGSQQKSTEDKKPQDEEKKSQEN